MLAVGSAASPGLERSVILKAALLVEIVRIEIADVAVMLQQLLRLRNLLVFFPERCVKIIRLRFENERLRGVLGCLVADQVASIRTTGDIYIQTIESSVLRAMNSRTTQVLAGRGKTVTAESKMPVRKALVPRARRLASGGCAAIRPSWTKP